jgi:hypothetical protein
MSDLVQRLRAPRPRPGYDEPLPPHPWMVEAADRIAQLEAALREACELFNRDLAAYKSEAPLVRAEIEAFLDRYESETEVCKHGNGEDCPDCAVIRAARRAPTIPRCAGEHDMRNEEDGVFCHVCGIADYQLEAAK